MALIAVVVLVGATALWLRSDARATESEPTSTPPAMTEAPAAPPADIEEIWRAHSPATPRPVVAGSAVITGAGGEVVGRDPLTGERSWRYARDIPLCTIGAEWGRAIAVHRKGEFCSEVTSLEGSTGERGPQRNSDARPGTRLLSDGDYVTATGRDVIGSWRSDLVRTQQYGIPPDLKIPDNNLPRPGCSYGSTAVNSGRIAFIEDCPREPGYRLTVIKAHPDDDEQPEEIFSVGVGESRTSVIGVTRKQTAVLLRDRAQVLVYNNSTASVQEQYALPGGAGPAPSDGVEPRSPERLWTVNVRPGRGGDADRTVRALAAELSRFDPRLTQESIRAGLAATPPGEAHRVVSLSEREYEQVADRIEDLDGVTFGGAFYWHTGTATVALDAATFTPLWTVPGTLGPGTLFGGAAVLPVPEGLALHDRESGEFLRTLPVDRQGYEGPISLDAAGDVLLEQRGDALVALR